MKDVWPLSGESKLILYLDLNYSRLEKEVWPFSMESKVHFLPQTQLLNCRESIVAIIWGIKNSFFTSNSTTQP